jgi:hypothetical protein
MFVVKSIAKVAPWMGFVDTIWIQMASGNPYNFPLYSYNMKEIF